LLYCDLIKILFSQTDVYCTSNFFNLVFVYTFEKISAKMMVTIATIMPSMNGNPIHALTLNRIACTTSTFMSNCNNAVRFCWGGTGYKSGQIFKSCLLIIGIN